MRKFQRKAHLNVLSYRRACRFGIYFLVPAVGMASPLLAIPIITRVFGSGGWASFAIGQSVGAALSVLVELGWGLNGPRDAARGTISTLSHLYDLAALSKGLLWLVVAIPGALVAEVTLSHGFPGVVGTACLAGAAAGLSPSWFFIGRGLAAVLVLTEAVPRLLSVVVGSLLLVIGFPLPTLSIMTLLGSAASLLIGRLMVSSKYPRAKSRPSIREVCSSIRGQLWALSGRGVGAIYIALPTTIVSVVSPAAVPGFAAVERLMRMSLQVLQGLPNAMQRWLNSAHTSDEWQRKFRLCITLNFVVGAVCCALFGILLPLFAPTIFSGTIRVGYGLAYLGGVVIGLTCTSRATGVLGLASLGGMRSIFWSALAGGGVGLVLIVVFTHYLGMEGAMAALVVAETTVLAVQAVVLLRMISRRRVRGESASIRA